MKWGDRIFRRRPALPPPLEERLRAWKALRRKGAATELARDRLVVVDVESSGLNLVRDRLIAIGAVALEGGRIVLSDSFETVLRQETTSPRENILIHGIGGTAQATGAPPQEALLDFLTYLRGDPLVAFHVTFDETMIKRAMKQFLGLDFRHDWLDLAYVAPALDPEAANTCRALDDWLNRFGIVNPARHNAMADSACTAQLFQILLEKAHRQGIYRYAELQSLEKARRWVSWEN